MQRRNFLKNTGVAVTAATALLSSMNSSAATIPNEDEDISEISIDALQRKYENGSLSAEEAVRKYLKRIAAIDKSGPALNAVIELNPDAIDIARQLDKERKQGKVRGPLHGVPVMIKDNIDTADKMQTTAGSLAMLGNIAKEDAFIVKKLRAAGAIIIGKTNLSEWANFRSTSSCSGWSSRGGQTKSPYILTHNPCGSSSGSGVAVSANLCTVAVGTETDGSVVCPAAVAGIVGLKPTVGLLSRAGIIPISSTQDTAGPLGRTVKDVANLLSVLTGIDENDAITASSKEYLQTDYGKALDKNALAGKRIGIDKRPQGDNQFLHRLRKAAIDKMKALGATIVEIDYVEKIDALGGDELNVLEYEFKDGVNKYLAKANGKMKSLKDVIEFNKKNEDTAMPYFKQEILEKSEKTKGLDETEYKKALLQSHEGGKKLLNDIMDSNNLDAITGLTMGMSCAIDKIYGDRWGSVFLTQPAAISGFPHLTVPAGQVYGLPVGISFFGKEFTEEKLLSMGYAFEQATMHRALPKFLPYLEA